MYYTLAGIIFQTKFPTDRNILQGKISTKYQNGLYCSYLILMTCFIGETINKKSFKYCDIYVVGL